ncbi:MAG: hypothetical protein AB1925_02045 [Actinomycetota bacterium]
MPDHHRLRPCGNVSSRLRKYVPEPATIDTSRCGLAVMSAWAVSIPVFPPPITHTGASFEAISSTSQKFGDTEFTRRD